jgi:hypothetical protein
MNSRAIRIKKLSLFFNFFQKIHFFLRIYVRLRSSKPRLFSGEQTGLDQDVLPDELIRRVDSILLEVKH